MGCVEFTVWVGTTLAEAASKLLCLPQGAGLWKRSGEGLDHFQSVARLAAAQGVLGHWALFGALQFSLCPCSE